MKAAILTSLAMALLFSGSPATINSGSADTPPRMVHSNNFSYPDDFGVTRDHYTGYVTLRVEVDEEGRVTDYVVTRATHHVFADAAIEGIQKTPFQPAIRNGQPIPVRADVQLAFQQRGVRNVNVMNTVEDRTRAVIMRRYGGFELTKADRLDQPLQLRNEAARYIPVDDNGNLIEGEVRMEYYIDRDGKTRLANPLEDAHPTLIEFALRSIESMEYQPPKRNNQAVPVRVVQTFSHSRGSDPEG